MKEKKSSIVNHRPSILGDMPADEFRRHGHAAVDWLAGFIESIDSRRVLPAVQPGDIIRQLPSQPPPAGERFEEIFEDFDRILLPAITQWNHPRFFAYFPNTGSGPGILGEMLAAGLNSNAMLWKSSPAATELETVTLEWLREMLGLPAGFFGVIFDTASTSTLCALLAARHRATGGLDRSRGLAGLPPAVLYLSEQAHSSVEKAAIAAGFGQQHVRKIAVDEAFRMRADMLRAAIEEDASSGKTPGCVTATVGTTSTTSVDPVAEIASVCADQRIWLHVDAAYAGMAAILPEKRETLAGCERADSLVVNPHKWLFTPMDCSAFYCRHPETLKSALSLTPEYLRTAEAVSSVNLMDYGFQLGRRFRALKLWMIIRYFGVEGIRARIRAHIEMAQDFAAQLRRCGEFEILAPHPFSTVCFRYLPAPDAAEELINDLNERLLEEVNSSGKVFLSHTKLEGKFTLRLAIGNIRTESRHVQQAFDLLLETGGKLKKRLKGKG